MFYYVIIRHLRGHRPVVHSVHVFNYPLGSDDLRGTLKEVRTDFCGKLPEFEDAQWYIDSIAPPRG